ncbi:MAG: hydroxymethylbilane synthase [Betaproteobacteria bacterium]|nr:hydroxymethylbilane synthase [Betaproteobacteria bacterium]MBI2508639.1 hydroxymethylbilane synthase [Betaproteobacteria bacterium]
MSAPGKDAPRRIVIATRESALAMWQARHVESRLAALYPLTEISILGVTTEGDRRLDASLAKIGGKGLFIKELEDALAAGRADIAVHSVKDVPMLLPPGFTLAAITEREDPRDAFISNRHAALAAMPAGARVGTSSLRRECQLRARYPSLEVAPLRGNVTTRLAKLDDGQYDAIIVAAAGLKRLGLAHRITRLLEPEESLPAPGQGALGLECRAGRGDLIELLAPLNHAATAACIMAERALSRALTGSCNVPLAAYAEMDNNIIELRSCVGLPDGTRLIAGERRGTEAEALGTALAQELKARGAAEILAQLEAQAAAARG